MAASDSHLLSFLENQGGIVVEGTFFHPAPSSFVCVFKPANAAVNSAPLANHQATTEVPKLDLDLYIQNYKGMYPEGNECDCAQANRVSKGRIRYDRLLLIGTTSAVLCVDALKAAVHEAKKGKDIIRYRRAVECLQGAAPAEPEAKLDQAWIETTDKSNKAENQRLENELKIYKNNLIKDSVRVSTVLIICGHSML